MTSYTEKIQDGHSRLNIYQEQSTQQETHKNVLEQRYESVLTSQAFFQKIAQQTQEMIKYRIEKITQTALDSVLPNIYVFHVNFNMSRGKTEVTFTLEKDGEEFFPIDNNGGGVVDIIALALRITIWTLSESRNTMILDEPLRFLSKTYRPIIIDLLKELNTKMNLQFIITTHDSDIIESADRVFISSIDADGKTHIKIEENENEST